MGALWLQVEVPHEPPYGDHHLTAEGLAAEGEELHSPASDSCMDSVVGSPA